MGAREVATALSHRARKEGRGWRTECPVHGGFSLIVADGTEGHLLLKCWGGGCSFEDIIEALKRRGLDDDEWSGSDRRFEDRNEHRARDAQHTLWALRAWNRLREDRKIPIKTYLRSRAITLPVPPTLRWAPSCKHGLLQTFLPAMVAKIVGPNGGLVAVHRTYLLADGSCKAPVDKDCQRLSLGPTRGGVVHLAPFDPDRPLIIGEGIETTMSLMQLRGLPGWAGVSTSVLKHLILPVAVRQILIAVDHDRNGAGERAARAAGQRWVAEGRCVWLAMPKGFGVSIGCEF